jgi:hypothetical protein
MELCFIFEFLPALAQDEARPATSYLNKAPKQARSLLYILAW